MKNKIKQYDTDNITNIICNYYNWNIEEEDAIKLLEKISKKELAEYILDSFNRKTLNSEFIKKINEV